MSEPRTTAHSTSRDLTPSGYGELRQFALQALAQRSRSSGGNAVGPAAAAQQAYDDLAAVSIPLIGQVGVDALTGRAVHLAQRQYSWLADPGEPEHDSAPIARVVACLARQDPAVATEGAAAVFAVFAGLLVTFIGEPLTTGLLQKAWPNAFSDTHAEER